MGRGTRTYPRRPLHVILDNASTHSPRSRRVQSSRMATWTTETRHMRVAVGDPNPEVGPQPPAKGLSEPPDTRYRSCPTPYSPIEV